MNWPSFEAFVHMGGYGLYVWGSYGVTLAALAIEALLARQRWQRARLGALDSARLGASAAGEPA